MVKSLTVYRASAGSGKTFRLATQYIKLVVQNPQAYRNILAVTFTNKATEEMKMRILSQLYGLWKMADAPEDYPESKPYMEELCRMLDAQPSFVSLRAGMALENLLHNYHYFRVMTIDTFFQSVLRNLARELDLTANLRIYLNDAQVEEVAVDQLIQDLQANDQMLQWILKYIMENISEDRSWNVIGQIKQFGKTIFRDFYKEQSKELSSQLQEKGFFDRYTRTLRQLRDNARERMVAIAGVFFDTLAGEGLGVDDLANKRRGIASFFLKLQNGIFDESIENATVANCLGDPAKWYTKTHPRRELIHALACGELGNLLRTALEERPRQWKVYQSAVLTLSHLNQLRLLGSIEKKVHELNNEANRFLLSDTQQLLHKLMGDNDSPFIFEKIGTQLEHVMIDEFQDTSTVQWQNFSVLLQETMSHKGSENLIVGDVKQSIYRWRSGDWRLLNNIEQQFPEAMLQTLPLKTNRRSSRRVIEFNNAFFEEAEKQERLLLDGQPGTDQLERAYQEVKQEIPEGAPDKGYVSVELLAGDDYQEQTLRRLVDTISTVSANSKPGERTAILVRTNNLIPLIATYIAENHPDIHIVSDEAFRLDASLPVNIFIQALHLLTHPDDQLARAYIEKNCEETVEVFESQREELLLMPLYELTERLFAIFRLDHFSDQSAYVSTFYDYLNQYIADNTPDIDGFVREWEESLSAKTIQSDIADGIRIVSIHKSKGLEFDHVIIPFCDWQLEKTGNVLWCRPSEEPFSELPLVPIDYSQKGMSGTIYESDYHTEHLQNVVDNLNLLYVAFTRARQSLYVIGKRGAKNSRSTIIESVLPTLTNDTASEKALASVTLSGLEDVSQPMRFEYGETDCHQPSAKHPTHSTHRSKNVFLQTPAALPVRVETFGNKVEFRQSNQSHSFTAADNQQEQADDGMSPADANQSANDYIQTGRVLHQVFSTIHTTSDINGALQRLQSEGLLPSDLRRVTEMLRKRLQHPKVADWFSPRWTLFNECNILSVENGTVTEHRPDRVMTDGREWIVVDFKFGRPRDEYYEQVRRYMQLLRQMGHDNISGYLWFVYSNQVIEVTPHNSF